MQEKIILGFLMGGEKTGYQIKKDMESSTQFIFNTSPGSIYPAFRKLEKNRFVSMKQKTDSGRLKKVYSIKPSGKKLFLDWMKTPTSKTQIVLLKIFFFSFLEREERIETIKYYLENLKNELEALAAIEKNLESGIESYPVQTLKYGIEHVSFLVGWFEKFLKSL